MGDKLDRTTGLHAIVDRRPGGSWYLIVAFDDQRNTRLVPVEDGAELMFGRSTGADVVIEHEAVSRRHTAIRRRGDAVLVEDLGSRNGTTINNVPITGVRRATAGDVIGVGPATAVVARSSASRGRQLATMTELEDRLAMEVDRALRYQRPLGVVMLRLEGKSEAVVAHVDRLLQGIRRMDLVAEYGPDELALVLPESDAAAIATAAQRASDAKDVTVRCGMASFPEDGSNPGALIGAARERLRGARTSGSEPPPGPRLPPRLVVIDPLMKQVFKLAERAAQAPISVLVVGETGTGKEVVAEAIHRMSPRAQAPFVRLNCAALTETLVESELFGHEKSAFTGATAMKRGFFEAATGGTLFLDEVGELPLATQVKLLRVLESWRIVRVGGTTEIPVDVRLVCATNRDLETEVQRGRFREDLFFRIAVFVIPVPPLRDRKSEIAPLAVHFAHEIASDLRQANVGFTPEAVDALQQASWPGNVRELRNVIERAVVLSEGAKIGREHLPEQVLEQVRATPHDGLDVRQRVANVERETVLAALDAAEGNQTQAAKKLGISRFALIRLMAKHDIKRR
ncbi:MAG: FHA domain-containing protein [Deltaproteobacteria bacterium]|nr:MAG: FHA domain-containing protein [Deltaproteobacteria bacterium]TMQ13523.1 MAG: FHA domain-containing protein [Deltaproteobacteria bacterium]